MRGLQHFTRLMRDRSGVTAIEYALIASVIVVAIVATVSQIGTTLSGTFTTLATSL